MIEAISFAVNAASKRSRIGYAVPIIPCGRLHMRSLLIRDPSHLAKGIDEVIPGETTLRTWTDRGVVSMVCRVDLA